jgi:hypothetical protein
VAQHAQEHDRDGLGQVQRFGSAGDDGCRVAQVRVKVVSRALRGAAQQRLGVREHDRVVVDVDDPGLRRDLLGDLVGALIHRDA